MNVFPLDRSHCDSGHIREVPQGETSPTVIVVTLERSHTGETSPTVIVVTLERSHMGETVPTNMGFTMVSLVRSHCEDQNILGTCLYVYMCARLYCCTASYYAMIRLCL